MEDRLNGCHMTRVGQKLNKEDMQVIAILHMGLDLTQLDNVSDDSNIPNRNAKIIKTWRNCKKGTKQVKHFKRPKREVKPLFSFKTLNFQDLGGQ